MELPKFMLIPPQRLDRYRPLLGEERFAEVERVATQARRDFEGHAIWHVSSTARGGGVAELLRTLLPYVRGAGIDTRWVVLRDGSDFFTITKSLHNRLHGSNGVGVRLGRQERRLYEATLAMNWAYLERLIQPGDVAYLHDPQPLGLVPDLKDRGAEVIWRCHVGVDRPNALTREAWDFLRPYAEEADAYVFSRREYVWDGLAEDKVWVMPPSIDAFSPKNQELDPPVVEAILAAIGLQSSAGGVAPVYRRGDGSPGRVDRRAELLQEAPLPPDARVVLQVSRWDRLKDPHGLLECFELFFTDPSIHLVLAAPSPDAVADDPEGTVVYSILARTWRFLPEEKRRRVHLVSLPMADLDENAAMVNAVQRRADVIVQKSIAEGFGLTVAEAMWKEKPVVGSRVGGIQDQIVDGLNGVLVDDAHDLEAFGRAIHRLVENPALAARLGEAGRQHVIDRFLGINRLTQYVDLVSSLMAPAQTTALRKAPTA